MHSFLSTLSSQFAKNILIGTLFPVVLFVIAISAVVLPLAEITPRAMFGLFFLWEQDSVVPALTAFVLIVTVVLFALNIPLIRLYEGYPWQNSWLGQWRTASQRRRAKVLEEVRQRARLLTRQAREANVDDALPADFAGLLKDSGEARGEFPKSEASILPTRLGNVIRAFEGYPKLKYGIDAVLIWPRLAQKLGKDAAETIDSAKASFDFMLNCSVLSSVIAASVVAAGLIRHHPFTSTYINIWPACALFFCVLAYLFYLGGINRAASWGTEVKVAFDLYRFDLLSGLGYKLEVSGPKDERALWEEISYQFHYPDAPNLTQIPYKTGQTDIRVTPSSVVVAAKRSMSWEPKHVWVVGIEVTNADEFRHEAKSVLIIERIPKGLRVVENSVLVDTAAVEPRSLDPLVVEFGPISPADSKTMKYKLEKI
jgi:hypothetical protein